MDDLEARSGWGRGVSELRRDEGVDVNVDVDVDVKRGNVGSGRQEGT